MYNAWASGSAKSFLCWRYEATHEEPPAIQPSSTPNDSLQRAIYHPGIDKDRPNNRGVRMFPASLEILRIVDARGAIVEFFLNVVQKLYTEVPRIGFYHDHVRSDNYTHLMAIMQRHAKITSTELYFRFSQFNDF